MTPPSPSGEPAAEAARAERLAELSPERRLLLRKLLEERAGAKRAAAVPEIRRREGDGPVPLSFAQQRLWFIAQLEPGSPAYNMPFPLRIRGGLDRVVLERALGEIARRHESLRTVFSMADGEPVQTVLPPSRAVLPLVDLAGLGADRREREAGRLADAEAARPFDLARGPLLRSTLLRLGEEDAAVLFTMHHIVSDGWSMGVLVREVSALYGAFARGASSPLPELPLQYPDYALWQREHLAGERLDAQIRYWKERLADAPPLLELPTDRPRPPVEDPRGALAHFAVPEETTRGLRALARSEGGTLFMAVLAGLQALLARYSGQDDVVVGSPIANRTRVELEGLIGFFVNTLVMRTDLGGDPTFRELLARVRTTVLEAQSNQDLPFERLVEEVQPERSLAHSPLFQVLLTLQNAEAGELELGPVRMAPMPGGADTAKFDLTVTTEERGDAVVGSVSYRTALWDAATIRRMLDHYVVLLGRMAADPAAKVRELELLTGAEREQVVRRWNATDAPYSVEGGLAALFEAQAARTPHLPAAVFGDECLSYAELDRRADALAARLQALGVATDARVGLCAERSLELVVGVLGTLKAGAAYVPIDPAYPEDRVAYMLEDAGISVLLTQERLRDRLAATAAEVVLLDGDGGSSSALSHSRTFALPHSQSLAYVIYTSGSTGRPKGVAMPQRPLLNLLAWQLRSWQGPAAARTLQFASISFDVSFQEIFSTWASGGTLLLVPEEVRTDMVRLARFLDEARVERIFLPFIALQHLAEAAEAEGIVPAELREVVTAGEQLRVTEPIRRWLGRMPGCALVNQYGPSETHVVTALALEGGPEAWPLLPSIGAPVANTQCYVLDRDLRPAPVGIPGELFLGGDNVARGYLGRPELTAERFVPDPFALRPGARVYRPGDRARWLAGGEIEFLGRTDAQVKVRGFRIEPGEVEAALEAHPAVREAVVDVREDVPGDRRLVAYLVPAAGEAVPGAPELRAWTAARLPEYMVPAAFVALDALPLTPSGKIHRRALPAPDASAADAEYVAPRTATEETLAGIFAAVLRRERVGVHDGFFALGGHSLLATRVASRVRDAFGAELPLRALFEAPTVAGLAERIDRLRGAAAPAAAPIPRRQGGGPAPLSFAQQRLWFIDRMEPGSAAYNLPAGLRLGGTPDARTLRRVLAEVVRRHESLRTVFALEGGEPVQVVLPAAPVRLPVVELGGLAAEDRERELRRLAAEEAARPFDLARGPLLRSALLRLGGGESAVLFTMHHVVSDGWSMGVLVGEVSALYAAFAEGLPSPLPELPVQYPDYAVWQRGWLTGDVLEAQLAFWRDRLAGAPPVLELPTDRPRPPVPAPRGDAVPFTLAGGATAGLRALAQREGTTLFGALLAGFAAVLARWSGQDDVVVGTPIAGRTRSELEGLIGFFVNTLVLRAELGGDPTLRALVGRARETVLGAQAHQDVPFERLVEELQPERSLQHTPLFQVLLALQNNERGELQLGGMEMAPLGGGAPVARFDLELSLAEDGDRVAGSALFRAALWERATVARMMEHLRTALEALAAHPDRRLSALELLTGAERARVLEEWNATTRTYPAAPAHLLFADAARRAPASTALAFAGGALTYAELDARSDALALRLRALGVGPEARVGLCVERTPEMVVGVLGIWKAGGAYVPLDPAYPAERLALIARDAGLRMVVASDDAAGAVPEFGGETVALDTPHPPAPSPTRGEGEHDGAEDAGALSHSRTPALSHSQLAYVIYTSGSTGTPKGVLVEHGALANLLHAAREAFGVRAGDVMPSLASFAFDIWLFETILPLTVGATARLVERERVMDPARLVEEVSDATLLHAVPALMRQVVHEVRASAEPRLAGVRRAFVGGDLVPPDLLAEMRAAFPRAESHVTYGPTEAAVLASGHRVPAEGAIEGHRIGAPLGNVRLYVCDALGGAQPVGVPGELRIGGAGVARGYLGRPELTAAQFVPDAFAAEPGARAYRSGDRARWLPTGELEFLGRVDAQVKIRGFRIEPGEVEAALERHAAVREAVAAVREDAPGERRLVAYVVAAEGAAADAAELRAHLKGRLPEYMVPSAVVVLDALPLTPTGKVDRRALPAPEGASVEEYVAPRTPAEEVLAAIWAEVLKRETVGVHDDFFALGGHSLLATRVATRVQEALGVEMPLRALFEAPTVAGLAERLEAAGPAAATAAPPLVRVPRDGPLPASFAQQRLWFIDRLHPGGSAYNIPFALRLRGAVDPRALRAALTGIAARHETLRTTFAESDGGAVQVIGPASPVRLPAADLRALRPEAREREARRLVAAESARPFDLEQGPLLRTLLVRLDRAEWALCVVVHHVASDGWSTAVMTREVSELYSASVEDRAPVLPELPVQYADYAVWQRKLLSGEALERQLAWWRRELEGVPPALELPYDRVRPSTASEAPGGARGMLLSPETTAALRALARGEGATMFMPLLATWQLLLARYAGTEDVSVGSVVAGRSRVELEGLIGFFVNTLVLRTDLSGDPSFRELLGRVRETVLGVFAHQEVPFEKLVEELAPERALGRTPFFQVMFTLQTPEGGAPEMGGVEVEPLGTAAEAVKFDLNLTLTDHGERIAASLAFRADLFDGATVERMLEHFRVLLEGVAADPARPVTEVRLLPAAERELVLRRWNDTARPFWDGETLHGLFARQAALDPEGAAVLFHDRVVSRAELDRLSARIAHALRRRGVGPETRVALYMEPCPEAIAAILGVMRAGGAYVPLDTAAPADRIAYMLEDSGAALVLATPDSTRAFPGRGLPVLEVAADAFPGEPDVAPEGGADPMNLAYVIYTSGSTGRPKGVMVPHRGVCNSAQAYIGVYGIRPGARSLLFAPLHFDASVLDVFTALASGAALVVAPREELMPGEELAGLLRRQRVTHVKGTPSAMVVTPSEDLPHLETVGLGGETCGAEMVARWAPGRKLFNGYGATEHSVRCTAILATDPTRPPPVGRPLQNSRIYVLDARFEPVPVGVPGEIFLAGVGVTRGYLNRPDLTAERFPADPYTGVPGARMYRSGDRGRWLPDGTLEFVGRVDFQVKIRGFRIEPGEIEAALLEHPGLLDAVVVARDDGAGGLRLAAYAAPPAGAPAPAAAELRAHLRERLPEYMIPASFTLLDALPLTSNGKVDRRALPAPDLAPDADAYVAPATPTEEALAGIWAEVLKLERVGARDDFFLLGGHSLVATRVIARAREAFGTEVPLRALFEAPTVAGLAERVDAIRGERRGDAAPPERIAPRGTDGPAPLSFAQQRLWFIQQMDSASTAYNMPYPLRMRGALDVAALQRAVAEMVRRHESLRTVFAATAGEPVQVVRPAGPVRLPVLDVSGLPAGARDAEVQRRVAEESARPFDLARGPLFRVTALRLAPDDWGVVFHLHHIVSDGWSSGVLTRETSALYGAFSRGEPSPLAPLPVQYPDFAVWQRERVSGDALEAQVGYWRDALGGAPPVLELPTDRPRPPVPGARADAVPFVLGPGASTALRDLAHAEAATPFIALLAAFQALMGRWSGQDDVVVGTPVAGRDRVETEGLIGFFVNTLVLRTDLSGDPTFRALLGRARETVLGAFGHQDLPFERLVEELRVERSLRHTPLFQVMFALQNMDRGELRMGELELDALARGEDVAKFDLSVTLVEAGDALHGAFTFRTDLFDRSTMERMADHFGRLLEAVAAAPDRPLSTVEILGGAERARVLEEWNAPGVRVADDRPVHEIFAAQVARTPAAVAVRSGADALTYAELDARSARLAAELRRRGVGPETRVGLCVERSPEMLVGVLGILRAGGGYVPLDPAYPAERLAFMLADAAPAVVVTAGGAADALPEFGGEIVSLDTPHPPAPSPTRGEGENDGADDGSALSHSRTPALSHSQSLAYVIYTSGSTGRPKGVRVTHRALTNTLLTAGAAFGFGAGDEMPSLASFAFDIWLFESLLPLLSGGSVRMVAREQVVDVAALVEEIGAATLLHAVPALMRQVVERVRATRGTLPGLRRAFVGGDAVPPDLPGAMREAFPSAEVRVLYGPTEATIICAAHLFGSGEEVGERHLLGRPIGNAPLYVLDPAHRPTPIGVAGELCIGGAGVARDYLGRPELTAAQFVPDSFSTDPGARMYRTGDRARWSADGVLEFLGRIDTQVKIRGFRIEPGEIEAQLAAHPAVRDAVVLVREDVPGEKRLVGYVVASDETVTTAELKEHLAARLPEYMVPTSIVVMESFPLSPNGKVDRKALPAPEGADAAEHVAPRTPTEEILAGIWADVLHRERVGVTEDFFALGGHSLLATQVVSRAVAALGAEIPLRALFEAPTVAGMAVRADAALREGVGMQAPPIVPTPRDGSPLPLSFAQQRLWFIDQLEPGSSTYNMPFPLRLRGGLDVEALESALAELVRRHESLRTVFSVTDGEPVQVILPAGERRLEVVDLRERPEDEREAEARRLVGEDARRPFDLTRGPLLRTTLLRVDEAEWVLLVNLHHIVSDGWSMGVLTREVSALYGAFSGGRPSPLPELEVQYADYAAWQRAWLVGETLERQIAYWKDRLAGAPPLLELPTDHPRPAVASDRGGARGFVLSAGATAGLRALSRREGATLFTTLLAGFSALLSRYAGEEDVLVGTPIAGRTRLETEALIGFFVNTLVLRTDLSGEPDGRELVGRVRERVLEAHAHQDLPFERLVDELSVERSLAHAPLFQAMFSFAGGGSDADGLRLGGVEVEPLGSEGGSAKFDLTLGMTDAGERLPGSLSFRTDLWEGATIERMLAHFSALLEALARSPEQPVAGLPMLAEAERAQVLVEWNATDRPYPAGERVHDLVAAQAARTPDAVAVSWRGERTTYAGLDRRANRLAHALRRRGVGPETRVGVSMARTPELLVALLGVLKAGGAYVPLDPDYPAERLGWMVEDAGIGLVLTESGLAGGLPGGVADVLALDGAGDALAAEPETAPESGALPDNLAYVIFTSGSTGRPKGVMVRHSSVVALLHWMRETFGDEERSSVLFATSVNFDVSVAEMFGTLAWGGKLVLVENALELPAVPAEEQVRYVGMVPTAAAELLRTGGIPAGVLTVNLAGEAVPAPLARAIHELGHVATLRNLYGPTEDTVFSTFTVVPPGADPVPMGRPLANSRAYVLDARLQPVPVGVVGELYLAGAGLARGYAARPELTAERFLPDPFGPAGARMYRVMDRVRRRPDGELEYSGRADFQVKVRGFRIELSEIEAVLARHPAVRDVVAVVREDDPGERRIVAYVTPAGDVPPAPAELREHAGRSLPEYMVPSAFVALEALPLSPNGKTDRRALPRPEAPAGEGAHVEPRTDTERALAAIWAETLRVETVGVHDGFFALGGHSLIATRVISRVRDALGAELPLRAIFEAPTVAALAARVDDLLRAGEAPEPAGPADDASPERRQLLRKLLRKRAGEKREEQRVRPRRTDGPVPLSFAQQRLWFIQQMDPASTAYNMPYPMRLRGALDVAAMRRSLTEMVARHESLRTVFAAAAGEPVQVVQPAAPAALPVVDLSGLPADPREAEVRRLAAEESARPFDLASGPLLRASLFCLADDDWGLVFDLHHIVTDGWSMGVLTREVSALYDAFSRGEPSPLAPLPVQYPDFAVWQREHVTGEVLEAQVRYWREALAGAPPLLELPTDRPRPAVPGARSVSVPFALPPEASAALRELARREATTPFITLVAAFQALLARWSGQDDVSVGTPVAGRGRLELEGLIGFFVNTLVLRADLSGAPSFRELLGRARERVLGAFAHQDVPFEKLVEELRVERSLGHTPLFQVMFALQTVDPGELGTGGLEVDGLVRGQETAKFDLSVTLGEDRERFIGGFTYRAELFERATVERMAEHFRVLLEAVAADPELRPSGVEVMGPAERRRVLEEWSRTGDGTADAGRCVHELFAAQAARTPGALALVSGEERVTYAELDARSAALARSLARRGVGPDVRVGICVERSPELVVGLLAVLRAGGAYVPLDPAYPAERLAYMLADAGVPVLLTQAHLRGGLPEFGGETVLLDGGGGAEPEAPGAPRDAWSAYSASPENLAYVIYTSGSTGLPKGTEVPHRAIPGFFRGVEYARWDETTTVLQHSSVSWDALTLELWPALLSGGTCVLYPGRSPEPSVLAEQVRRHGVNTLWLTSAYFNLLVDGFPEVLAGVEQVMTGGETVSVPHARRALELYPALRLVNGYGPSETTVFASCFPVPAGFGAPSLPVGRPVGDRRVYLLDRHFGPVPQGAYGELCIGGPAVARGYLGRPGLTAERFVPDAYGEPGSRLYRSGDRARWRADGLLEFAGRTDFQAKIRGFRIEPGEVEAQLAAHPAVRDAVVLVREDVPGEKRLVGYVVASGESVTTAELREHLAARLPEYMVPAALMVMQSFPLSPNGKTDRGALPAPEGADAAEHVAPRTPTEEILVGIWADVLHRDRVGVTEDFFALGGHSLLATQVVSRAVAALGVEIPLRALFEAPTVAGMAVRADAALREGVGMQAPPIVPTPRDGSPLPLSFAQQRLWFIDQLEPGRSTYNMPFPLRLRGGLDVAALEGALAELVRRHESLRTVFAVTDGEPVQVILPAGERRLEVVDLRERPEDEREAEARRLVGEDARRPFDLTRGPLLRTTLLRVDEAEWVLLVNLHHIVSDGWSMGVLTREVSALYGAYSGGRPSPLPELEVQYADYAAWQRAWLTGETLERQIAYWKERLAGAPPLLELPTDHPRPAVASDRGGARGFVLSAEATAGLRALARREGATLFTVLLAGFSALLSRYTGEEDVLVGTPIAGRTRLETEALIGFFVNTLVLRTDLSGEPDGRELVGRVRERVLEAHAHQDLPFERLVDELSVERSLAHAPLFQAMFTFGAARGEGEGLDLGGVEVEPLGSEGGSAKFDLTLGVTDAGERFAGSLSYRTDLWEDATIGRMAGHLAALLEGMAREPERPFTEIPFLPADEREQVLAAWNDTDRPYPAGERVHDLFAAQAARTPDAVAVSWRGERTTYAELDRRANRLAHALRRRGVGPETRVGVCMGRTPELLVALLGVLKAGGAYVPLDPAYPAGRLGWMVEDAGIGLVLTEQGPAGRLPAGVADVLALDGAGETLAAEPETAPESGALPDNLAFVIFTSGSTGRPKGVMVRHSSVAVLLHWMRETFSDEERSSVLFATSVNFDVSVAEMFGTLAWGGKLVLVDNALELPAVPAEEQVRTVGMVPTAAAELLRTGGIPASVLTVNLAGEAVPAPLARAIHELGHVATLRNLYGPTEDTVFSTFTVVPPGADPVPIGRPLANSRAYVLDAHLQPVPVGVIGELYLAGDGLARGYAARPELTAERFLPCPYGEPGERMYRVMDRVRWRLNGELEYFGRTDFQVKVRGFRIELGEIEAVLARHPAVREAVAVAREDTPGDRRIVAYVTPAGDGLPEAAELREHVAAHLPEYMVPSAVVALETLPLSPNGKTDRRALPAPDRAAGADAYVAPRDTLELALARIWEEVLGVERVGVRDGFFALGGHSLLAVRLMSRVEQATGARLPLAALFTASTVEQLARELRRGAAGAEDPLLVPIRAGGHRPPLFLVHPVGGNVLAYAALARHLGPEQPVYALRSRGLAAGEEPAGSVEEMAGDYLAALREAQPSGPYRLGGWSMGGVVAFEMARRLEAAGERVERLVLVDAHVPALHGRVLPRDPAVLVGVFAQDMGLPPELLALPEGDVGEMDERAYLRRVLEGARAAGLVPPDLEPERIERLYAVFRANLAALYGYRPEAWGGAATLLRAAEHDPAQTESAGWERLAEGGVEVRVVPGSHFTMVREPNAEVLAREVERALDG